MDKRERILGALTSQSIDRVPLLGGWVIADTHFQALASCTAEQFWRDPEHWAIKAYKALGIDGLIKLILPVAPGEYRGGIDKASFESYKERYHSPEDVLDYARSLPSPQEAARLFNQQIWEDWFRAETMRMQGLLGDIVWLPTLWEVVHPKFEWYTDFGYENYLLFMQLYPEAADAFFATDAAVARLKAEAAARVYRELDMVPLTLIGADICGGGGPLISPAFLREHYFTHVRYALQPLHDAGINTVWHSDGDIRPLVDDLLACGISGLQGFQTEYGVVPAQLARKRTLDGRPLTLFCGSSVTRTMPFGSMDDVRAEVRSVIDDLQEQCRLFFITTNHTLPDVPVESIVEAYRYAAEYSRGKLAAAARAA